MKKYILLFLVFSLASALYFLISDETPEGFVSMKNDQFILNNEVFQPIVINYITSLQQDGKNLWVSSCKEYEKNAVHLPKVEQEYNENLFAEMTLIKDLGFNTVRIVGVGEPNINDKTEQLSLPSNNHNNNRTSILLNNDSTINVYLESISNALKIVDRAGLKAIFLIRIRPGIISTEYLLTKFCQKFKNNTTLMTIDIYNEPLYFDKPEKSKQEVFGIVNHWKQIIKTYAPNHLMTIGLAGMREVFRWDPNILDVDFISYHPYEYEPEQVRNEIYWYGKYTEKSWIIGETAIPADNDSITYEMQRLFAKNTLNQTFNCGGIGYSWWQYKDVDWHKYHANFMGLLTWNGETLNSKGKKVNGTLKPTASAFKNYVVSPDPSKCKCFKNYYNYSESKAFKLTGKILDEKNEPIEGAVVLAWNKNWSHSYHTVTKEDGSFELLGSYPFYHWMASATKYTTIRDDIDPQRAKNIENYPTVDLKTLTVVPLPFLTES